MEQIPNWKIHQPANYSHHFSIWIQETLLGKTIQEENQTFFYNFPTSLKLSIFSITNDGSILLNPFKLSMDDNWKPNGGQVYQLSYTPSRLCSLSIVYWLLVSFLYFIPMLNIRFLLFCNSTTAKLFNNCSRNAVLFGATLCLQGVW